MTDLGEIIYRPDQRATPARLTSLRVEMTGKETRNPECRKYFSVQAWWVVVG